MNKPNDGDEASPIDVCGGESRMDVGSGRGNLGDEGSLEGRCESSAHYGAGEPSSHLTPCQGIRRQNSSFEGTCSRPTMEMNVEGDAERDQYGEMAVC